MLRPAAPLEVAIGIRGGALTTALPIGAPPLLGVTAVVAAAALLAATSRTPTTLPPPSIAPPPLGVGALSFGLVTLATGARGVFGFVFASPFPAEDGAGGMREGEERCML